MKPRHFWVGLAAFLIVAGVFWYQLFGWAYVNQWRHPLPKKTSAELMKEAMDSLDKTSHKK